jgi:hypothetical protein
MPSAFAILRLISSSNLSGFNSMYDFASRIAAGEIFPRLAFGFEPLDPTVLIRDPSMPECEKRAIR